MVLPRISTNVSVIDIEPEANPLPLYLASHRAHAGPAGGHAGAALARQALPRPAHPHRPAAGPPRRALCRRDGRLRRRRRRPRPACCRCCSSARWTCTRPPSRWASRSRTCTHCGWAGDSGGTSAPTACSASRWCSAPLARAAPQSPSVATISPGVVIQTSSPSRARARCAAARAAGGAAGRAGRRCRGAARCPSPAASALRDCSSISSNWSTIICAKSFAVHLARHDHRDVVQLLRVGHRPQRGPRACASAPAGRRGTSSACSGSRLPPAGRA